MPNAALTLKDVMIGTWCAPNSHPLTIRRPESGFPSGKNQALWAVGSAESMAFGFGFGRERGARERRERGERETRGYEPFALHSPIHWAI